MAIFKSYKDSLAIALISFGLWMLPLTSLAQEKAKTTPPKQALTPTPETEQVFHPEELPQMPGSFGALSDQFQSFLFQSKREIQVQQDKTVYKRKDQVKVWHDEKGNFRFKKTSSPPENADLEFIWLDDAAYRPDLNQWVSPLVAQNVFQPLLKRNTNYWAEFWQGFPGTYDWEKKKETKWQGRPCDRYVLFSPKNAGKKSRAKGNGKFPKIQGEILVDLETGLLLKTSLEAQYALSKIEEIYGVSQPFSQEDPPSEKAPREENQGDIFQKPFAIHVKLEEEVKEINQVAVLNGPSGPIPKSKKNKKN